MILLALSAIVSFPFSASAADPARLQPAPGDRIMSTGSVVGFELGEICVLYRNARDGGFDNDASHTLRSAVREYPVPAEVAGALTRLASDGTPATSRDDAQATVLRFFGGVCNSPQSLTDTACTLMVTFRRAQPTQLPLLAAQLRFVATNTTVASTALEDAFDILSEPIGNPETFEAANDIVRTAFAGTCGFSADAPVPATTPGASDVPEPVALAETGVDALTLQLLQGGLAAVVVGASLLGYLDRRGVLQPTR